MFTRKTAAVICAAALATSNGLYGKLYFPIPQTTSPITMSYDNVDRDVHFTFRRGDHHVVELRRPQPRGNRRIPRAI